MLLSLALAAAVVAPASAGERAMPGMSLQRAPETPAHRSVKAWYSAIDRTLEGFQDFSRLLAAEAGSPTVSTARKALDGARAMAEAYRELDGDASAVQAVARIERDLERWMKGRAAGDALPREAFERVISLEEDGLHRLVYLLRQGALEAPGPRGLIPANAVLSVGVEGRERPAEVLLLDVSTAAPAGGGRPAHDAVEAAARRSPALRAAVCADRRVWLRHAGADLFADLSPAHSGGLLRASYREPGFSTEEQARFYFLAKVLYGLGFSVNVENGVLSAELDAGRRNVGPLGLIELLSRAVKAADEASTLPGPLKAYLADSSSSRENERRMDYLARAFLAEGGLAFLREGRIAEYRAREPEREDERARMNKELARRGLDEFPSSAAIGRRTIELFYEWPIEAASVGGRDVLARLAGTSRGAQAARLAPLAAEFRTIGEVGGDLAQSAGWRVAQGQWLIVHALRSREDGRFVAFLAEAGQPASHRALTADAALAQLRQLGVLEEKPLPPVSIAPAFIARLTYDRTQALGDRIYATPFLVPADRPALRRSRGLLTTGGGRFAAALAADAGIPAVELPRAEWTDAGLRIEEFVFSPSGKTADGKPVRGVLKRTFRVLREGEAVRFDPRRGSVDALATGSQAVLVRLEEALRAYERSLDIDALSMWTTAQLSSGLDEAQKAELKESLIAELKKRRSSPEHLERIQKLVR